MIRSAIFLYLESLETVDSQDACLTSGCDMVSGWVEFCSPDSRIVMLDASSRMLISDVPHLDWFVKWWRYDDFVVSWVTVHAGNAWLMATQFSNRLLRLDIEYFDCLVIACCYELWWIFGEDKRSDLFVVQLVFSHFVIAFSIEDEYPPIGCT